MFKTVLRSAVKDGVIRTETIVQEISNDSFERIISDDHEGGAKAPILVPFIIGEVGGLLAGKGSDLAKAVSGDDLAKVRAEIQSRQSAAELEFLRGSAKAKKSKKAQL